MKIFRYSLEKMKTIVRNVFDDMFLPLLFVCIFKYSLYDFQPLKQTNNYGTYFKRTLNIYEIKECYNTKCMSTVMRNKTKCMQCHCHVRLWACQCTLGDVSSCWVTDLMLVGAAAGSCYRVTVFRLLTATLKCLNFDIDTFRKPAFLLDIFSM